MRQQGWLSSLARLVKARLGLARLDNELARLGSLS
jgi:hypothetical protein